jgi:hypothetical protein
MERNEGLSYIEGERNKGSMSNKLFFSLGAEIAGYP